MKADELYALIGRWRKEMEEMECLPDANAWATTRTGVIYFKADNGDGVLMPVYHKEDNE